MMASHCSEGGGEEGDSKGGEVGGYFLHAKCGAVHIVWGAVPLRAVAGNQNRTQGPQGVISCLFWTRQTDHIEYD